MGKQKGTKNTKIRSDRNKPRKSKGKSKFIEEGQNKGKYACTQLNCQYAGSSTILVASHRRQVHSQFAQKRKSINRINRFEEINTITEKIEFEVESPQRVRFFYVLEKIMVHLDQQESESLYEINSSQSQQQQLRFLKCRSDMGQTWSFPMRENEKIYLLKLDASVLGLTQTRDVERGKHMLEIMIRKEMPVVKKGQLLCRCGKVYPNRKELKTHQQRQCTQCKQ